MLAVGTVLRAMVLVIILLCGAACSSCLDSSPPMWP